MDGILRAIAFCAFFLGRIIFFVLFYLALRTINFTQPQIIFISVVVLALMMVRLRKVAIWIMCLAFVWSIGVTQNLAPDLPAFLPMLSHGVQQTKSFIPSDFSQAAMAKINPIKNEGEGQSGKYDDQIASIDFLTKSGAIQKEDADRIKLSITKKALEERSSLIATQEEKRQ